MPYVQSSAPYVFHCFVNFVLWDFLEKFMIAYIDEILIFLHEYSSHDRHVNQVLAKLKDNKFYVKAEKCVPCIQHYFPGLHYRPGRSDYESV